MTKTHYLCLYGLKENIFKLRNDGEIVLEIFDDGNGGIKILAQKVEDFLITNIEGSVSIKIEFRKK